MKNLQKQFLTFATIFTIIVIMDFVWLGILQKNYFAAIMKKLNCGKDHTVNWPTIVITYFVMAFSIYYFVFYTVDEKEMSLATVMMRAVLIAMAMYVVVDFTLLNMTNTWTMNDAIKDILWGNVLCVSVAVATYYLVY